MNKELCIKVGKWNKSIRRCLHSVLFGVGEGRWDLVFDLEDVSEQIAEEIVDK